MNDDNEQLRLLREIMSTLDTFRQLLLTVAAIGLLLVDDRMDGGKKEVGGVVGCDL